MKILFAISVLSFCLLLWAAVAITRHIRRSQSAQAIHAASTDPDITLTTDAANDRIQPLQRARSSSIPASHRQG